MGSRMASFYQPKLTSNAFEKSLFYIGVPAAFHPKEMNKFTIVDILSKIRSLPHNSPLHIAPSHRPSSAVDVMTIHRLAFEEEETVALPTAWTFYECDTVIEILREYEKIAYPKIATGFIRVHLDRGSMSTLGIQRWRD